MRELATDEEIERALRYLVNAVERSGENPKPVILHSTRVGLDLYHRGYGERIVIAGLLHDLLEDTAVTAGEIRSAFGDDVADIVAATSYDPEIDGYLARHRDIYERCFAQGRPAVVVKAADILDNSDYYGLGDAEDLQAEQLAKMEEFTDGAEPHIGTEQLHRDLAEKLTLVKDRLRDGGDG